MTAKTKSVFSRIAVGAVCVAILAYTVFHMISLFSSELSTVVVGTTTDETKIAFSGYIFRDEELLFSEYGGAVDYVAEDGLKVAAGDTVAVVYEQGNYSNIIESIDMIDHMVAILEEATDKSATLSDLPDINMELRETHGNIMTRLANGDIRGISENISSMTADLGKISALTSESSPVTETLEALRAERQRLMAAGGNSELVKAQKSGYFFSGADGYEGIFTMAAADSLTPDNYFECVTSSPSNLNNQGAVGRMIYSSEWKFAANLPLSDAQVFEEGGVYETVFTGNDHISLPLTLESITRDDDAATVLLIFSCDRMPKGFSFDRFQSVEVTVKSVTGINVPKSATHRSGGKLYVYILKGSVVFERCIEVIHEGSDFYTVRDGVEDSGEDVYLQSNDILILDGQNLFDGRILE